MTMMITLGIVEIVKIGTRMRSNGWTQAEMQAYQVYAQGEKARRKAERAAKKQTIMNIIVSAAMGLFLLIGGAGGNLAFRGTNSGALLIVIGLAFLIWTVISAVRYATQRKAKRNAV